MAAIAVGVCLLTAIVVSAWPIWQAARADLTVSLKRDAQTWHNTRVTRGGLIAAQLALSLILLAGFGLVARAFVNLRAVPLGFDPDQAATMFVSMGGQRFGSGTVEDSRRRRLAFYRQLANAGGEVPGVERFGLGFPAPMTGVSMVQPFKGDTRCARTKLGRRRRIRGIPGSVTGPARRRPLLHDRRRRSAVYHRGRAARERTLAGPISGWTAIIHREHISWP